MTPRQKVTVIVGEPCVGKSMIVKELLRLELNSFIPIKWTPHHKLYNRLANVLGRYDDSTHQYPGTDRLSMAVQPHAIQWIMRMTPEHIIFEGDRLGNYSMLKALQNLGVDLEVIHLFLRPEWLAKRRELMRPNQNPKHWARCKTKVANLIADCNTRRIPVYAREMPTPSEAHDVIAYLRKNRMD